MDNFRAGTIAATVANVNRGKKAKPFRPQDFFMIKSREPADPAKIMRALKAVTVSMGGKVQ